MEEEIDMTAEEELFVAPAAAEEATDEEAEQQGDGFFGIVP